MTELDIIDNVFMITDTINSISMTPMVLAKLFGLFAQLPNKYQQVVIEAVRTGVTLSRKDILVI